MNSLLAIYLFGVTGLSLAMGVQIIVLPWLAVDTLALSPSWVGWIQAAVLIPNLFLLLFGGITADRSRGLGLSVLLWLLALAHAGLYMALSQQWLSFLTLLAYSLLVGSLQGFIQPWREYLLSQLGESQLQSIIAKASLCQYGGQAVGILMGTFLDQLPIERLLIAQVVVVVLTSAAFGSLQRMLKARMETNHIEPVERIQIIDTLKEGISMTWQQPILRSLLFVIAFNGCFHIGVFVVALPLLVRDIYAADVTFYAWLQLAFVAGTIVVTLAILRSGKLAFPGRRLLFSLLYSGVILLGLGARPTLIGLVTVVFLWGVVAGVSSNMGRAILQAYCDHSHRGRSISIYQLALFGAAPIGALLAGYGIAAFGVLAVLKASGVVSIIAFVISLTTRPLWDVEEAQLMMDDQTTEHK